ncbi:T9SS type B sorting domain-containing protein [Moheibacter sediminis]|nr:T9SS type B sorting domain-containing protein [Moheibacter sediminis]
MRLLFFTMLLFSLIIQAQIITDPVDYRVCDEDGDGFVTIPFSQFQSYALDVLEQFNHQPEIYVTQAYDGIAKITSLYNNPQVVNVCSSDGGSGYYDIAINDQQEVFVVRGAGILQKIDTQTCQITNIGQVHSDGQTVLALSFDKLNNLYEGGWTSQVYRAEANDLTQFSLWHNFGNGRASGDFVQIRDFLYVAWTNNGRDYLYKVTLGTNNEYVSHESLGPIEQGTFGLASEYGRLYGNTTDYLYEINLETMERTIIRFRPNSGSDWWGAAGLHEALNMQISYHEELNEALDGSNPLSDPYTNSTPFADMIYIRIHESTNNDTYIIPVSIIVDIKPEANDTTLTECLDENLGWATFYLNETSNAINPTAANFTYYASIEDLNNNINPLPIIYEIPANKTIYAKVKDNSASACYNVAEIELIVPSAENVNYEPNVVFCLGTSEVLSVPNEFVSYQWNGLIDDDLDQNLNSNEVIITHPGNYFLTVTDINNCTFNVPFTAILDGMPEVTDVIINGNSITVEVSPSGQYEYSLNGIFWQSSNTFHNVEIADYEIYVRDFTGCRNDGYEFIFFNVPNFISPNGDGYNDVWTIRGITQYPDAHVQIFDRYGKLFIDRKAGNNDTVWDGKYLGREIPSGTYWYIIKLKDEKRVSGSILVKN